MTGISIVPKIQKGIEFEQMVPRNLMTMLLPPQGDVSLRIPNR